MASVYVSWTVEKRWTRACRKAMTDLNRLFKQQGIKVVLATSSSKGASIHVSNDVTIQGDATHGRTSATTDSAGKLIKAEVKLPVNVTINTPNGVRDAGEGVLEVIVAHEYIHALGQSSHSSHLMGRTFGKDSGSSPSGDRLTSGVVRLPPLTLSSETVDVLKALWN